MSTFDEVIKALLEEEEMNKENYKYALENIYPEYYKDHIEPSQTESATYTIKNRKNCEEKKIESKLKMIIFNLEREIQEQTVMKRRNKDIESIEGGSKASMRSYSMKSIKVNPMKCFTEENDKYIEENEEKFDSTTISTKKSHLGQFPKKGKVLELPKLNIKNKLDNHCIIRRSLSNKKYKLMQLDDKEKHLGKVVLQKLEQHLKSEKEMKKLYYERVKSVEVVDDSFICHLKSKIKRADVGLTK